MNNKLEYRIVNEVSRPRYYDFETGKLLGEDGSEDTQAYWVVIYNTKTEKIDEWVNRFDDPDDAQRFIDNMNRFYKQHEGASK